LVREVLVQGCHVYDPFGHEILARSKRRRADRSWPIVVEDRRDLEASDRGR
jgi:hypothetical protein